MDVTGLDNATGKLVVQIRLDEIMDALRDIELETDSALSYQILRHVLEDQLELFDEEQDNLDGDSAVSFAASEYSSEGSDSDNDRVQKLTVRPPKKGLRSKLYPKPKPTAMCCACGDDKEEKVSMKLSCSHIYCHDCIIDLFRFSIHQDATLFPPRCCKVPTPFYINSTSGSHEHSSVLPDKLLEEVRIKKAEYDFVHATFCSTCGRRIPEETTKDSTAECRSCNTATCTTCKNKAHKGVCPEDDDTKLLIAAAEKVMWQRCSQCKNMVELDHGCFHIRYAYCVLPHEFP
ncbi:hypothetical protein TUN199_04948 [Pyrenophora tritici-repentis]|uniref:RING finger domain containing protein n=1 Tax=Pyrenophora tritici-repentis TaxID=45151 RepID=A0A317ACC1_9PLEO|nr:hypothetical protein A1F99_002360 [Pyrenophora tritici-repentis]KAF7576025.1 RING finger domain containing protein [Pyrenophora tritici-repentis]KAI0579822.1 hypothetical protein Alg215_05567 [Pyrenophora tritici-repentis]KAI0585195.1 hypothetical protein Alg130_04835 [Pyrenophora tritici-repentis]KAI0610945.1 hypothetical protein TUN205_04818 [Pyrenophora tritici-repentis]